MKKYRIRSKFRFTVFMLIMMIMICAVLCAGKTAGAGEIPAEPEVKNYVTVEVMAGDTLWDIAGIYAPEKKNIREFIYEIRKANGLERADIYVGQTLIVPAA